MINSGGTTGGARLFFFSTYTHICENLPYHRLLADQTDDTHHTVAHGARKGIGNTISFFVCALKEMPLRCIHATSIAVFALACSSGHLRYCCSLLSGGCCVFPEKPSTLVTSKILGCLAGKVVQKENRSIDSKPDLVILTFLFKCYLAPIHTAVSSGK